MLATTYKYAQENLDILINQAVGNSEQIIITDANRKAAVLMSLEEFNSWQETIYLLSNPYNAEHILQSIKQAEAGEVYEKTLIEV